MAAPDIYVWKDATGANNGTSWADAFNTSTAIQDGINAATSGQKVGIRYSATAYVEAFNLNKANITLAGYDSNGDEITEPDDTEKPTISGTGQGDDICDLTASGATFNYLIFDGTDSSRHGINHGSAVSDNLTIRGCEIKDIGSGAKGVNLNDATGTINTCLIEDCLFGPLVYDSPETDGIGVGNGGGYDNFTIRRCTFQNVSGEQIQAQWEGQAVSRLQNYLVEDCVFLGNGVDSDGVKLGEINGLTIRRCCFEGIVDTTALEIPAPAAGWLAEDIRVKDCDLNAFRISGYESGGNQLYAEAGTMRRCEAHGIGDPSQSARAFLIEEVLATATITLENCTGDGIIKGTFGGDGIRIEDGISPAPTGDFNIKLRNCIFSNGDNYGIEFKDDGNADVDTDNDYDCIYNFTAGAFNGLPTGWTVNNPETNGITSDPQFQDRPNDNLNLEPTSPCIGAGDPAVASQHGRVSDMGAREYGAPVTRPSGGSGRPARLRHGKYYRGSSAAPELLELVRMER